MIILSRARFCELLGNPYSDHSLAIRNPYRKNITNHFKKKEKSNGTRFFVFQGVVRKQTAGELSCLLFKYIYFDSTVKKQVILKSGPLFFTYFVSMPHVRLGD